MTTCAATDEMYSGNIAQLDIDFIADLDANRA